MGKRNEGMAGDCARDEDETVGKTAKLIPGTTVESYTGTLLVQ